MEAIQIYQPIQKELEEVGEILETSLEGSKNESILKLNRFLLESPGKRLRPALVILCAKASSGKEPREKSKELAKVASAIELIHIASLVHDDVIDHSYLRHNKPTVNIKWGQEVSIALGDYLYSLAFELISQCNNMEILQCIASATKAMCEGELIQVVERDNLDLLRKRYIIIAKKKTASLFVASCQAGAMLTNQDDAVHRALRGYGLNFGIAFQIIDDCLDLIGEENKLGKSPGADFRMGELTLPVLNLLAKGKDRNRILSLIKEQNNPEAFRELRQRFINSPALLKTKRDTSIYIQKAKKQLCRLEDSCFKQSLLALADFIIERL